jgi:hypothetical protein
MSRPKNDEGYMGNPNVKRDGVEAEFSEAEIKEYRKCMMDPAYFARTYLKVISLDEGLIYTNTKKICLIILMIIDSLLF